MCKYGPNYEKCETCGIKYNDYDCFLEHKNFKDNLIEYKCSCCNENYEKKFHRNLKETIF